jgi:hypothetical protein
VRERRSMYRILVGKCEGQRPLGRPSHRLEGDIESDFKLVDWTDVAVDKDSCEVLVNAVVN